MKSLILEEKPKEKIKFHFTDFVTLSPQVFGCKHSLPIIKDEIDNFFIEEYESIILSDETSPIVENPVLSEENDNDNDLTNGIFLEPTLIDNDSVEIEYQIPSTILYQSLWIGIYDQFEPNNQKYLQQFTTIKQRSHLTFKGLKRGKYSIRLFINKNKKKIDYYQYVNKDIIIGNVILMNCSLLSKELENDTLQIMINEPDTFGWIGIYDKRESNSIDQLIPNDQYQLCSSITNKYPLQLSISHLPKGSYECRFFTKESCNGILMKTYHCSGISHFTI